MGFNSAFKGLNPSARIHQQQHEVVF